jgi:hypothetical protein
MLKATYAAGDVIRGPGVAFRVRRVLGVGGMGEVYEVDDNNLGVTAVLKMLRPEVATDHPSVVRRFTNEAKVLAKVVHRHCVRVTQLARTEAGIPFYVMENIQGVSLRQLIAKRAPLPVDISVKLTIQLLYGLEEVHKRGVIHRDIKPDNILVCREESELVAKIIDFGVMRLMDDTSEEGFCGTPVYAAPEQIDMRPPSAKMDVFAAGLVVYEMLTGRRPYESFGPGEQGAVARVASPAPLLSEHGSGCSDELVLAVATILTLSPEERPSAREAALLLQRVPDLRELGPAAMGAAITQDDLVKAPKVDTGPITLADMSAHTEPDGPPIEVVEALRRGRFPTKSGQTEPPSAPRIRKAEVTEPDAAPPVVPPREATLEDPKIRERALRAAATRESPVDAPAPKAKPRSDTVETGPQSSPALRFREVSGAEERPATPPNAGPMTQRSKARPQASGSSSVAVTPSPSPASPAAFPRMEKTTPLAAPVRSSPPKARSRAPGRPRRRRIPSWIPWLLSAFFVSVGCAIAAFVGWTMWKNRGKEARP